MKRSEPTCNTCTRSIYSPYRVYDERGKVIQGCVDASHTGHLMSTNESNRWHLRPEAKQIRTNLARMLAGKGAK